jgi:hypothetical protein
VGSESPVDAGGEIELLTKESAGALGPFGLEPPRTKAVLDALTQGVAAGGMDDAIGGQAGGVDVFQTVMRQVDEIIDLRLLAGVRRSVFGLDVVQRAMDLVRDCTGALAVVLDQASVGLLELAGLLLDQQDRAGLIDDDEIQFAQGNAAAVLVGPVYAMEYRERIR